LILGYRPNSVRNFDWLPFTPPLVASSVLHTQKKSKGPHPENLGRYPVLTAGYVLPCSHTKNYMKKFIKNLIKIYE
jgi:hypothetical protein